MYIYIYVYIYTYICICTSIYRHMCVYINIYTYAYTHRFEKIHALDAPLRYIIHMNIYACVYIYLFMYGKSCVHIASRWMTCTYVKVQIKIYMYIFGKICVVWFSECTWCIIHFHMSVCIRDITHSYVSVCVNNINAHDALWLVCKCRISCHVYWSCITYSHVWECFLKNLCSENIAVGYIFSMILMYTHQWTDLDLYWLIRICVRVYLCTYICVRVYTYTYTYIYTYYIYTYVCVCVYVYTLTWMPMYFWHDSYAWTLPDESACMWGVCCVYYVKFCIHTYTLHQHVDFYTYMYTQISYVHIQIGYKDIYCGNG